MMLIITCLSLLVFGNNEAAAKSVKVKSKQKVSIQVNKTKVIKANQKVKWSLSNKNVQILSGKKAKKVKIRAVKKGKAVLVAKKHGEKKKIHITITKKKDTSSQNTTVSSPSAIVLDGTTPTPVPTSNPSGNIPAEDEAKDTVATHGGIVNKGFFKVVNVENNKIICQYNDTETQSFEVTDDVLIWKKQSLVKVSDILVSNYICVISESYKQGTCVKSNVTVIVKEEVPAIGQAALENPVCWGQYYVAYINENNIGLAQYAGGEIVAYTQIEEKTAICLTNAQELTVGQRVVVECEYIQESFPATLVNCKSVVS